MRLATSMRFHVSIVLDGVENFSPEEEQGDEAQVRTAEYPNLPQSFSLRRKPGAQRNLRLLKPSR
jgi:ribonuclease PH